MTSLKQRAIIVLANSIKGSHAEHHASVLVNGAWLRNRSNEAAAYAEILSMSQRYAA